MPIQKFEAELVSSSMIAPSVKSLILKKSNNGDFSFAPGQFITCLLTDSSGKVKRRSYSISDSRNKFKQIEIAVSYVKGGVATDYFSKIKEGDRFNAIGPVGRLTLKDNERIRKLVLVGTGTGISPYRAMLPLMERLSTNIREIYVLAGARSREDAIYSEDFRTYSNNCSNLYFRLCLSREENHLLEDEVKGYVQSQFNSLDLGHEKDMIYLCGNPNMIDQSFEKLIKDGFHSAQIRREKYVSSN